MAEKKLNDSILDTLKDIYFAEPVKSLKTCPKWRRPQNQRSGKRRS
jgi:ferritin-like metal-binding protein YciE